IAYSLEVSLEVYWDKSSVSIEKVRFHSPIKTGVMYNTILFLFSEIFSSDPPNQYRVKASIAVFSFDGIKIDDYVMPINVIFSTEPLSITDTSQISSSNTTTSKRTNGIEVFFTILTLTIINGIITIKRKKIKEKGRKSITT
ncbi:MAG: hypothetical protein ACFFDI_31645, partial [Promethearchaeota archaeon]